MKVNQRSQRLTRGSPLKFKGTDVRFETKADVVRMTASGAKRILARPMFHNNGSAKSDWIRTHAKLMSAVGGRADSALTESDSRF
jgi:hypothetical protein